MEHLARPMLCPPDNEATSSSERPSAPNLAMMEAKDSVGEGSAVLAREALADRLSRRPSLTFHDGPFTCTTASRAAMARMSAHETWVGHAASSSALIASTTSNPRREFLLGAAFFSPVIVAVSSNNTEASHPYITKQKTKTRCR